MYKNCIHYHSITQKSFTALSPVLHLFTPSSLQTHFFYCLSSLASSRMSYGWNYIVCSLYRLTVLSNVHLRFFHVFHGLIAHSFYGWIIHHHMDVPHFLYPLIGWWTLGMAPLLATVDCAAAVNPNICFSLIFLCASWLIIHIIQAYKIFNKKVFKIKNKALCSPPCSLSTGNPKVMFLYVCFNKNRVI